jgi:hypothetical protein
MHFAPPPRTVALQFGAIGKFTVHRDLREENMGNVNYQTQLNSYFNNWIKLQGIDLKKASQPVELIQSNNADTYTLIAKTGKDANIE